MKKVIKFVGRYGWVPVSGLLFLWINQSALIDPVSQRVPIVIQSPETTVSEHEVQTELPSPFFPVPEKLKFQVEFWHKIFTQYGTNQIVLHDNRYVNVIFDVIDIRNYKTRKSGWKQVKAKKRYYKKLLQKMVRHWGSKNNAAEQRIYDLYAQAVALPGHLKKYGYQRIRAQEGLRDNFKAGIVRAGRYLALARQEFSQQKLPLDLVYLAMVESSYNPHASSFAGAAGIWQFMRPTARQYGLKINGLVDQRRDPLKSTQAAAALLSNNYRVLESWPLAVTAYNHGVRGVLRGIRNVKSMDLGDIIEKYKGRNFHFASRNFYAEFLAAVKVCKNYRQYYGNQELTTPLKMTSIKLKHHIAPDTIATYCGVTLDEIKTLNPALRTAVFRKGGYFPKDYSLNLPGSNQEDCWIGYAAIPANLKHDAYPAVLKHRIQKGENLSLIASMYKTSVRKLRQWNSIRNPRRLRPGQFLTIHEEYSEKTIKKKTKHRVRRGQTLSQIAQKYNLSIKTIARYNSIPNPSRLRAGQILHIPGS